MLVLSRKSQESVVVGGPGALEPLLKVTVLEIKNDRVRLGFEADAADPRPSLGGVGTNPRRRPAGKPRRKTRARPGGGMMARVPSTSRSSRGQSREVVGG